MDRYSRSIYLGLLLILTLIAALVAAAVTVTFPVDLDARITNIQGEAHFGAPHQTPAVFGGTKSGSLTLRVGDRFQLEPGDTATVLFFNDGIATLRGPAGLVLRESFRRGTLLEHVQDSDKDDRDYTLTVEQYAGSVEYRFDQADPAFDRVKIRIQVPNEVYIPSAPCWHIEVDAAGQASSRAIDCSSS